MLCCKRWDEDKGRAEATAMGFDVLVLQSYLRSSLQGVSCVWGTSTNREGALNARLGWSDDSGILSVWMEPAKTGLSGACFMNAFWILAGLSKCWWVLLSHSLGSFLLKGSAHALQGCKDVSDSSCWEAQEKGRWTEPFFCLQTPAC